LKLNTPANKAISITNHASIGMVGMFVWDTNPHDRKSAAARRNEGFTSSGITSEPATVACRRTNFLMTCHTARFGFS
jgi:hypothetical protein